MDNAELPFSAIDQHFRCVSHIPNRGVQDLLKALHSGEKSDDNVFADEPSNDEESDEDYYDNANNCEQVSSKKNGDNENNPWFHELNPSSAISKLKKNIC